MKGSSTDGHKCPGCGRSHDSSGDPVADWAVRRKHFIVGTVLLLIPALSPFWLNPLARALVGFHQTSGSGWIIEEAGKRFLFAAISTASAMTGAYLFTSAMGFRVHRKPGI